MRKTIPTLGMVSAGLLLVGSPAQAVDTNMSSSLNIGIANGIQASLPIQAPINVCGNAIGILGSAMASCVGGAHANYASGWGHMHDGYGHNPSPRGGSGGNTNMSSSINAGIANGIQVDAKVQAPINICGNAIGILATAMASCMHSGAMANMFSAMPMHKPMHRPMPHPQQPYGRPGGGEPGGPRAISPAANKAQGKAPVRLRVVSKPHKAEQGLLANLLSPVTGLLGGGKNGNGNGDGGGSCGNVAMSTFGNVGIANGIQAHAPIQIPINFAGNGIGILGQASGSSVGGAHANYCS